MKISSMQEKVARSLWCNEEVGFLFSDSRGLSGGIIIFWKVDVVEVLCSFRGEGFLGVKVKWCGDTYYIAKWCGKSF